MEYYFDLETTGLNPKEDKIISIQYQQLDREGNPIGDLVILKEWELGEEEIIKRFFSIFDKWSFIPIGTNLNFDFKFLASKINKYTNINLTSSEIHSDYPHIDIKPILILLNNGNFKGASLHNFTDKGPNGFHIPTYYNNKEYNKITEYIEKEAKSFISFYQFLKNQFKYFNYNKNETGNL
jgi:hypothetical protein